MTPLAGRSRQTPSPEQCACKERLVPSTNSSIVIYIFMFLSAPLLLPPSSFLPCVSLLNNSFILSSCPVTLSAPDLPLTGSSRQAWYPSGPASPPYPTPFLVQCPVGNHVFRRKLDAGHRPLPQTVLPKLSQNVGPPHLYLQTLLTNLHLYPEVSHVSPCGGGVGYLQVRLWWCRDPGQEFSSFIPECFNSCVCVCVCVLCLLPPSGAFSGDGVSLGPSSSSSSSSPRFLLSPLRRRSDFSSRSIVVS